jgi:hypothetical protein
MATYWVQNQAVGAGTCAIRLLRSLGEQDPGNGAPRVVFSVTTEGPMKELWVHYWVWTKTISSNIT